MKLKKIVAGELELNGRVCITDPCYSKDTWCRINDIEIEPGEYQCVAWISDEGMWGERVSKLGIYLNGEVPDWFFFEHLNGDVGVDAGLAGVYENKPDFTDSEWDEFCKMIGDDKYWVHDGWFDGRLVGFTTSSGFGDGSYEAQVAKNEYGRVEAIEIIFIEDEEDDEEEWDWEED